MLIEALCALYCLVVKKNEQLYFALNNKIRYNMKNKIMFIALAIVVALTMTSCKKDKENPTITINLPVNHSNHTKGAEIHIEASFTDDRELKSYHIHIGTESGEHTPEFDVEFEGDLSGKIFDFHEHFHSPTTIGSVYYLHFEVMDAEGKSANEKVMLHFM